jgi:hypothetical protein
VQRPISNFQKYTLPCNRRPSVEKCPVVGPCIGRHFVGGFAFGRGLRGRARPNEVKKTKRKREKKKGAASLRPTERLQASCVEIKYIKGEEHLSQSRATPQNPLTDSLSPLESNLFTAEREYIHSYESSYVHALVFGTRVNSSEWRTCKSPVSRLPSPVHFSLFALFTF